MLWMLAFVGYRPALGISKPIWETNNRDRVRTPVAHLAFSITTFTVYDVIRPEVAGEES